MQIYFQRMLNLVPKKGDGGDLRCGNISAQAQLTINNQLN